jgi:hypothetical protein
MRFARTVVVTNGQYRPLVAEQMAAVSSEVDILREPVRRDPARPSPPRRPRRLIDVRQDIKRNDVPDVIKNRMNGEMSTPPSLGTALRIGRSAGSVMRSRDSPIIAIAWLRVFPC